MLRFAKWAGLAFGVVLIVFASFVAWNVWRSRNLLAFCNQLRPGLTIGELHDLERRHGVDDSYIVQAKSKDYVDQAHSPSLNFRSQMMDPDFECAVNHDGHVVTSFDIAP